jgi:hypothetical protein
MQDRLGKRIDRKTVLSALWVFVVLNYLYADLLMMIVRPGAYETAASRMPPWVMLAATGVMELLLGMVFLARMLPYRANRRLNIVAGVVGTLFVAGTLGRQAPPVYVLVSGIEILSTVFIVVYAWTWRVTESD